MQRPRFNSIYHPLEQTGAYRIDSCLPQTRAAQQGKIELHALTKGHYPGIRVPPEVLPGLNSIGFWNGAGSQDWGLDEHRNEGLEISLLETGRMVFTVDTRQFDLTPGNLTITRPWQLHKLGAPNIGPGRMHWLILDVGVRRPNQPWRWPQWLLLTPPDLAELTRKLRHNETPVWKSTAEIRYCFQQLSQCILNWDRPHAVSRLIVNLNQLFAGILDALSVQQISEDAEFTSRRRTVEMFLKDLEANPATCRAPWTLAQMSRQCGMGVTAFSKYTRELMNTGPIEFLNQCRLEHAAQDLRRQPQRSVTEIAFANGFNSSQYFATCFRQRFKISPSRFQQARNTPANSS